MESQQFETFIIRKKDDVTIAKVTEKRIYMQTSEQFADEIDALLGRAGKHLVIDLSDVSVMNSSALGVLIGIQSDLESREGGLAVVGLQPLMQEIFSRMRLELLIDIGSSVDEAVEGFAAGKS